MSTGVSPPLLKRRAVVKKVTRTTVRNRSCPAAVCDHQVQCERAHAVVCALCVRAVRGSARRTCVPDLQANGLAVYVESLDLEVNADRGRVGVHHDIVLQAGANVRQHSAGHAPWVGSQGHATKKGSERKRPTHRVSGK